MVRLLIFLSIVLQSFSFLSLKYASLQHGAVMFALLALAGLFLVARALVWNSALGRAELSRIYPFTALFQILIFLYAVFLFGETAEPHHIVGLGVMLAGLMLIARERP